MRSLHGEVTDSIPRASLRHSLRSALPPKKRVSKEMALPCIKYAATGATTIKPMGRMVETTEKGESEDLNSGMSFQGFYSNEARRVFVLSRLPRRVPDPVLLWGGGGNTWHYRCRTESPS